MLIKISLFLILILLFLFLGKAADLVVLNIRKIGEKLGIKIFILGIILGILTNLPEIVIAINSSVNNIEEISFGNLLGGVLVLFGLILPINIILNRKIKTPENSSFFLIILSFLFIPVLMGLKGFLSPTDGLILMILYLLLIYYIYKSHSKAAGFKIKIIKGEKLNIYLFYILLGIIGILVSSELIIKTTLYLIKDYNISTFVLGLLLYSIGTNLPELIIVIRSYKRKMEELSFSSLIGSALSNTLIIGTLGFVKGIEVSLNTSYYFLVGFSFFFFIALYIFYKTDRLLSRWEGLVLLFLYFIFLVSQIYLQVA